MTSLWQLKRFEARIPLFKSLDCPLALAAAGMNQRFTRYPPVINHNLGWCNWRMFITFALRFDVKFSSINIASCQSLRKFWGFYQVKAQLDCGHGSENGVGWKSNQISLLPCQYTIWWEAYINSYTAMGDIEASAYWSPVLIKVLLKLTMAMFYIITT